MPFEKPRIFSPNKHAESAEADQITAPIFVTGKPDLNESSSAIRPRNAGFGLGTEPSIRGETSQSCDDDLGLPAELQMLAAQLRGEADALDQRYAPAGAPLQFDDRRFPRRWIWRSVAAGLIGIGMLAWQIERTVEQPRPIAVIRNGVLESNVLADAMRSAGAGVAPSSPDPAAIRRTQGIAEASIDQPASERHPPADQIEMLRMQVSGFEKVIQKLQLELKARDAVAAESQHQIETLQFEVDGLRKQLDEK